MSFILRTLDLVTSYITNRINQPGYKMYGKVQTLLLKAAASQPYVEELRFVLSFYGSDFDSLLLLTHLETFFKIFKLMETGLCINLYYNIYMNPLICILGSNYAL